MTYHIQSTGAQVNGCNDVGLDPEGAQNWSISNFTSSGCLNGELSIFPHAAHGVFSNGTVNHSKTIDGFGGSNSFSLFIQNGSNDPTYENDIVVQNVNFNCLAQANVSAATCGGISLDPSLGLKFVNNTFVNTPIFFDYANAGEVAGVQFLQNTFQQTALLGARAYAINLSSYLLDTSVIQGNHFSNTVTQAAGAAAIYRSDTFNQSYNGSSIALNSSGNSFSGWSVVADLEVISNTSGVNPTYNFTDTDLGGGSITTNAHGLSATFNLATNPPVH